MPGTWRASASRGRRQAGSSPGASAPPARRTHQSVRIQEDTLAVPREGPAVQLGERDAQLRPPEQGQAHGVRRVRQVHLHDLVEHPRQDDPAKTRARRSEDRGGRGPRRGNALRGSRRWGAAPGGGRAPWCQSSGRLAPRLGLAHTRGAGGGVPGVSQQTSLGLTLRMAVPPRFHSIVMIFFPQRLGREGRRPSRNQPTLAHFSIDVSSAKSHAGGCLRG